MVYHFFSQWKKIKSDVFSIKKQLTQAEKIYKLKITLFELIWISLRQGKIEHKSVKRLLKIYTSGYENMYTLILKEIRKAQSSTIIPRDEINQFYELISILRDKTNDEKEIALIILNTLITGKIPENNLFYTLQALLKQESQFLQIDAEKFKKIEEIFLLSKQPGRGAREYIPLLQALADDFVQKVGNKLYLNEQAIRGVEVIGNKLIIIGDHYTSAENAQRILGETNVEASLPDPFSYMVERGKLDGLTQKQLKYNLGAVSAEVILSLEIEVFPEQVYLRLEKNSFVKFAIAQLLPEQVHQIIRSAKKIPA